MYSINGDQELFGTAPIMSLRETDAAVDGKIWDFKAEGGVLSLYLVNDARSPTATVMQVTRSVSSITKITFPTGPVVIGGTNTTSSHNLTVAHASDARFDVRSNTAGHAAVRIVSNNAGYGSVDSMDSSFTAVRDLTLQVNGGTVGIGTADFEAWSVYKALQLGATSALMFGASGSAGLYLLNNLYYDGGWKYKSTGPAMSVQVEDGRIAVYTVPSGTIDTTAVLTGRLAVTNAGAVVVGLSTSSIQFGGSDAAQGAWISNDGSNTVISAFHDIWIGYLGATKNVLIYPGGSDTGQRVILTTTGLGIGIAPTAKLHVAGVIKAGGSNDPIITFASSATADRFSTIRSNSGVSSHYNSLSLYSNAQEDLSQGNVALPSWIVDIGGRDNFSYANSDTFNISRRAPAGATTELFRITNAGNVGIGTDPSAKLHVAVTRTSTTNAVSIILSDNVTGAQTDGVFKSIRSISNVANSVSEIRFIESDGTNNNTAIGFATASNAGTLSEKIRVDGSGRLLVLGLTGGSVYDASTPGIYFGRQTASTETSVPYIRAFGDASTTHLELGTAGASATVRIYTASIERIKVTENGNVIATVGAVASNGITINGTSSPRLRVANTGSSVYLDCQVDGAAAYVGTGSAHPLILRTSNTEYARLTTAGVLLVGVTSPVVGSSLLEATKSQNTPTSLSVTNQNTGTGADARISIYAGAAFRLIVNGANNTSLGGGGSVNFYSDSSTGPLSFFNNSLERLRIHADGSITINGSASSAKLTVHGTQQDASQTLFDTRANNAAGQAKAFQIVLNAGTPDVILTTTAVGTNPSLSFAIGSPTNIHMRLDSGGSLLTNTGVLELNALATGNRNSIIDFHGDDTYTDFGFRIHRDGVASGANGPTYLAHRGTGVLQFYVQDAGSQEFWTSNTNRMIITSAGAVQKNGTTANITLDASGTEVIFSRNGNNYIRANGGASAVVNVVSNTNGVALLNGATAWSAISDKRLKDVSPDQAYPDPLGDIAKIEIAKFTYLNDGSKKQQVGVIAQSVLAVVPEACDLMKVYENDGDLTEYLAVRYTELIPLQIAAIQALLAKTKALEDDITALRKQLGLTKVV